MYDFMISHNRFFDITKSNLWYQKIYFVLSKIDFVISKNDFIVSKIIMI